MGFFNSGVFLFVLGCRCVLYLDWNYITLFVHCSAMFTFDNSFQNASPVVKLRSCFLYDLSLYCWMRCVSWHLETRPQTRLLIEIEIESLLSIFLQKACFSSSKTKCKSLRSLLSVCRSYRGKCVDEICKNEYFFEIW